MLYARCRYPLWPQRMVGLGLLEPVTAKAAC